ncbi:MAG: hypothetical protein M1820_000294 [Bogoriella megaspora]|nr:MAG: hypothetical protein M1820_000294 [Bogoriella megaspora]
MFAARNVGTVTEGISVISMAVGKRKQDEIDEEGARPAPMRRERVEMRRREASDGQMQGEGEGGT